MEKKSDRQTLNVASVGCLHGQLDLMYSQIKNMEIIMKQKIDVVLVNGDFQAMRTEADLSSMACPPKYRQMGDFHHYFSGSKIAPCLTIIIGGNHEASSYFSELYYGGWIAKNIYYLGKAGVVLVNGFRIAGLSGIYNQNAYRRGYTESIPLDEEEIRSIYYTREFEILKLSLMEAPIDLMLSHDWPRGAAESGDLKTLLHNKPYFEEDIRKGRFGSPATAFLLSTLHPKEIQ